MIAVTDRQLTACSPVKKLKMMCMHIIVINTYTGRHIKTYHIFSIAAADREPSFAKRKTFARRPSLEGLLEGLSAFEASFTKISL